VYPIPNFANDPTKGSNMIKAGNFEFNPGVDFGGTNQWMNFPSMSSPGFPQMPSAGGPLDVSSAGGSLTTTSPGIVPPSAPWTNPGGTSAPGGGFTGGRSLAGGPQGVGTTQPLKGNAYSVPTVDPGFTQALDAWLQSQLGKGATPFDLSAILPSTGQATAPGTLTAPENPILQSLQNFYQTGQGGPLPGVLPMWQSAMKSMQIPIEQQLANIKEQFGSRGALGSSEMASALETFGAQTAADQENLLGQLTLQALPGMENFGENLQQLDQSSINNLLQEFIRTRPESSPLLGEEFGLGTLFPPTYSKKGFGAAFGEALGGGLGSGLASLVTG